MLLIAMGCTPTKEKVGGVISISDIELTDLNGEKINLTDQKGKTLFINFWATWCRPCLEEMPSIVALQELLKNENIEFYFASDEDVEKIQRFIKTRQMNSNFVRVENPESLGIEALPTTFIFDGNGELVFSEVGYRKWDNPGAIEIVRNLINNHD